MARSNSATDAAGSLSGQRGQGGESALLTRDDLREGIVHQRGQTAGDLAAFRRACRAW